MARGIAECSQALLQILNEEDRHIAIDSGASQDSLEDPTLIDFEPHKKACLRSGITPDELRNHGFLDGNDQLNLARIGHAHNFYHESAMYR